MIKYKFFKPATILRQVGVADMPAKK